MKKALLLLILSSSLLTCFAQSWLWGREGYTGYNTGAARSIAADNKGNVFISSIVIDTLDFGPFHLSTISKNAEDIYMVKYDSNGNALWAVQ